MRLVDGALYSMPITLDVSKADIENLGLAPGARLTLRDPRDDAALAIITSVSTIY
jgi:sulfate adenylyltransferase